MAGSSQKLTEKQKLFIEYYLIDLNATQAAIKAGYSKKTADRMGFENLRKPLIQAEIRKVQQKRSDKLDIKAEDVVRELARVAFSDMRKAVTWGPDGVELVDSNDIDDNTALAVQSVTETTNETQWGGSTKRQIKMHDKIKALELLSRHLGILDGSGEDTSRDRTSNLGRILDLARKCGRRQ